MTIELRCSGCRPRAAHDYSAEHTKDPDFAAHGQLAARARRLHWRLVRQWRTNGLTGSYVINARSINVCSIWTICRRTSFGSCCARPVASSK